MGNHNRNIRFATLVKIRNKLSVFVKVGSKLQQDQQQLSVEKNRIISGMGVCMSMEPLNENQIMACCPENASAKEDSQVGQNVKENIDAKRDSTTIETIPTTIATNKNMEEEDERQCVESIASSESSDSMCIIDNHVERPSDGPSQSESKESDTCKVFKKPAIIHKRSIPTIFIQFASTKRISKSFFMEGSDERYLSP